MPAAGPTPQMVTVMPDGPPEPKRKKLNPDMNMMTAAQANQQLTHAQEMAEKVEIPFLYLAHLPSVYLSVVK